MISVLFCLPLRLLPVSYYIGASSSGRGPNLTDLKLVACRPIKTEQIAHSTNYTV